MVPALRHNKIVAPPANGDTNGAAIMEPMDIDFIYAPIS